MWLWMVRWNIVICVVIIFKVWVVIIIKNWFWLIFWFWIRNECFYYENGKTDEDDAKGNTDHCFNAVLLTFEYLFNHYKGAETKSTSHKKQKDRSIYHGWSLFFVKLFWFWFLIVIHKNYLWLLCKRNWYETHDDVHCASLKNDEMILRALQQACCQHRWTWWKWHLRQEK